MILLKLACVFVVLFLKIPDISCEATSLAFAIDDGITMDNVIGEVKREAVAIMKTLLTEKSSEIKDFVLITINNPDVVLRMKANSPRRLLKSINQIYVHKSIPNEECEKMSLTGIKTALKASRSGSYIFVFTDSSSADYVKVNTVKSLCQKKQSQVVIVVTGDCGNPSDRGYTVYYEVAVACSGQVFRVKDKQIDTVIQPIKEFLKTKRSVVISTMRPRSEEYLKVPFSINETSDALVSLSGQNAELQIKDLNGLEPAAENILRNDYGVFLKLNNLQPGTYNAYVKGTSVTNLMVYVPTPPEFAFDYDFFALEPNSMTHTLKHPIAGKHHQLSINVNDPKLLVNIQSVQILDMKDNVIKKLPLRKTDDNVYITNYFITPTNTFTIKVIAELKKTSQPFTKKSDNIEPTIVVIPDTVPDVSIVEGVKLDVNYGGRVSLTCKVIAHPPPTIKWLTAGGITLLSESFDVAEPPYTSNLKLKNIKKQDTFICQATNTEGTRINQTRVDVRPVFNAEDIPAAKTTSKYGENLKIQCKIKSYLPIKIKWFRLGRELRITEVYSISADGSELTLKSMDLGMQGKYICEASLTSDPTKRQNYETEVVIPGLARPVIESKNRKISVTKRDNETKLDCKTAIGYPTPRVQWFKKNGNNFDVIPHETSEELTVPRASITHAGQYKCVVENVMGNDSAEFVVIPESEPVVTINEGSHLYVNYGAGLFLSCRVTAHPPPTIKWSTIGGNSLRFETTVIEVPSYISYLNLYNITKNETYVCKSTNTEGTKTDRIQVDVRPVFNAVAVPAAHTTAKYGEVVKIQCNIKSYLPMKIKWFRSGKELSTTSELSISANRTELTLNSMDLGMQGKYTCEAALNLNPMEKQTHETTVTIPGLERPVVESKNKKIYVKKRETETKLNCKNVRGYPKPQVQWFQKNGNKFEILPHETSETLTLSRAIFTRAGKYKCIAKNVMGSDSTEFVVITETEPVVNIDEGIRLNVDYGAGISLTCKVTAHPLPTIEWIIPGGISLSPETSALEEPLYISHLKLSNVKKNGTYICKATNAEGTSINQTQVEVRPVFKVIAVPEDTTAAKYGEDVKIQCNIKSYLPIKVRWFGSGKELTNSTIHSISADGMELTLKAMNLKMEGKYYCEAFLTSDPSVKQTHETIITIPGKARPVVESKHSKIHVKKGDKEAKLNCKTVKGNPKPHVQWFMKNRNEFELLSSETSEVLIVSRASFTHAGQYKCVVQNVMGSDSAEFVVIPESEPVVTIDEGAFFYINYGAGVSLTCRVTAHPPPTIEWFTFDGISLPFEEYNTTVVEEPSYISYLNLKNIKKNETYVCKSTNTEGTRTDQTQVDVRPLFIDVAVPAANTTAKYGEDVHIQCNIKSSLPMKIKWFRSGIELSNTTVHSISSDGMELTLKSMELGMQGRYNCEASLNSDPTQKQTHETTVIIPGLERPAIGSNNRKIYLKKRDNKIEFSCRTIRGYPKPQIRWFQRNGNKFELLPRETSEVLRVARDLITHAGKYRCVANNAMGNDSAEFVVIKESEPVVNIAEGVHLEVDYGAKISLTCKVTAHPLPTIEWIIPGGISLSPETSVLDDPLYISHLKLSNIKKNGTYICKATNAEGTRINQTQVDVRPVFKVIAVPEDTTAAKYREDVKIQCNIKSYLPIKVRWFGSGKELTNSTIHSISADGMELTLKAMNLKMEGKYYCEAFLSSDPSVKQTHETIITIPGKARPVVESKNSKIHIKKGDKEAKLNCKTVKGNPKPNVQWFKKNHNEFELLSSETSEVLTVSRASFTHAAQYKCVVQNVMGSDSAEFVVIPESEPVVTINEGAYLYINYGAEVSLTCRVTAHPAPTIEWLTIDGISLPFEEYNTTVVEEPSYISYLNLKNFKKNETYVCKSTNTEGTRTDQTQVDVRPLFIDVAVPAANTTAKYGEDVNIQCKIKSSLPMKIKWFRSGIELSNTTVHSISSDGMELTLKSMELGMQGRYNCEASLISDPTQKQTHETTVTIPGLERPAIGSNNRKIYLKKRDNKTELSCRTIRGYPKPQIQWFQRNGNKFELLPRETSEVLRVARDLITHAGKYRCVANNAMGNDSAEFVVIKESEPVVNIAEGVHIDVDYGAGVSLTCKVTAHPLPTIEWIIGDVSLPSETTVLEEPSYVSHITLKNIKNNGTYICKATNTEGTRTNQTQVDIRPVFNVEEVPAATTTANYGEDVKIQCNIKSYLPIKIKWFRSGRELSNTTVYSITADGSELTLRSIDLGMQGKYTCEVSSNKDPIQKQTHETTVTIPGLERPIIESNNRKIYIKKNYNETELNCGTVKGYPKPHVQWFKKNGNKFEVLSHDTSDKLTLSRASIAHAGQYKCVVQNVMGNDSAEFVVIPESEPDVNIDEGVKLYIDYGAEVSLTCKVFAHPPPTIKWLTAGGNSLQSETTLYEEPAYVSYLKMKNIKKNETFVCQATNTEGTRTKRIQVDVRPVFINNVVGVPTANVTAKYSEDVRIHCNIKSHLPIKIKWLKSGRELINTDVHSISADGSELTLKSMDLGMEGKYTCEVSLKSDPTKKQTHDTEVKITGLVLPEITHYSTVVNGINLTAICRINGVPKPTISWQFKPKGSEEFTTIPGSEEELNIPQVKLRDSGIYKCIVKNVLGQTQQDFNIIIKVRPSITNEVYNYFGVEGDLVLQIPCNVTGFPDPTIVWKEGGKTIENDSKYVVEENLLYIKNPVISDTHNITCEATNKLGSDIAIFYIEVTDTFEDGENLYGDTHDVNVEEGQSINITCNMVHSETDSVRWYRNGKKTNQTGSIYIIEETTVLDDGNYTCRVNTNNGSKSETSILNVGMAPVFEGDRSSTNNDQPIAIDWNDAEQTLDCRTTTWTKPIAKIEWSHNGEKIESLNDLYQITITDWGEYTCTASNIYGTIQKTFKISTSGCYIRKTTFTPNTSLLSDLDTLTWPNSVSNVDIFLLEQEEIKLLCPNNTLSENAFEMFSSETEIIAQCQKEDIFLVDGKPYRYKDLQCKRMVESSVLNTSEQCSGSQSEMIRAGFAINGFLEAFEVCYDRSRNVPLYASTSIKLTQSGNGVDLSTFIWKQIPGLGDEKPTGGFTCEASDKCCYAKGQLLNAQELAFGPAQVASFTENLNSIAVWNPCSDSNRTIWQDFEKYIRSMSSSIETWSSWTGASEYVKKNGGLVPRYLWKVMSYDATSTVMVYVNDEAPVANDIRCTKPCESMMETADKFLYCCSLEEFSEVFGIPSSRFNEMSENQSLLTPDAV